MVRSHLCFGLKKVKYCKCIENFWKKYLRNSSYLQKTELERRGPGGGTTHYYLAPPNTTGLSTMNTHPPTKQVFTACQEQLLKHWGERNKTDGRTTLLELLLYDLKLANINEGPMW